MANILVALSPTEKRVLFTLLIVVILALAIIGLIGSIITKVMKKQGDKMDALTYDVTVTRIVNTKEKYLSYARKKNCRLFFLESWIPLLILTVSVSLFLIVDGMVYHWTYNMFDPVKQGISTWFFTFDFSDPNLYTKVFGMTVLAKWPAPSTTPHWSNEAWLSYICFPCFLVGGIWYLIRVQRMLARMIRMYQNAHNVYKKSLEGYNQYQGMLDDAKKSNLPK